MIRWMIPILCLVSGSAVADRYEQAWQEPAVIQLPEPMRSVVLRRGIDPVDWMTTHAVDGAQVTRLGKQSLVEFRASEQAWQDFQTNACTGTDVISCESVVCQAIQLEAEVQSSQVPKARIVKKVAAPAKPAEADAHMCSAPVPVAGVGESTPGINLDLELPDLGLNEDANEPQAAEQPPEPAAIQQPQAPSVKLPFQLSVASASGMNKISAPSVPADSTQYDLLVGEGCEQVRIPLDSLSPAHVPGVIVAVLQQGQVDAVAQGYGLTVLSQEDLASTGDHLVTLGTVGNVLNVLPLLSFDSRVTSAQQEFIYTTSSANYSDPFAFLSYGPAHTGALELHAVTQGGSQSVAVIDTGVKLDHPELVDRVEGLDFTGSGYSGGAHGTAVAGIIAATADNAVGAFGVAPGSKILALKACEEVAEDSFTATCKTSSLVKALDAAITKEATIINMSLAGPPDPLLARYVAEAIDKNILVIAGAGNGGPFANPAFPAALPDVLAITALDGNNRIYASANTDDYVDLAAPGVDIVTLSMSADGYPSSSGTSWAAAHVSGVALLLKDLVPFLGASEISWVLNAHSIDLGEAGRDPIFGTGLIDACAAAQSATADAVACGGDDENVE